MANLDLTYPAILKAFGGHMLKERTESRAFLAWFLDNYYRLDETEVSDCICDGNYDKGIDGVYINEQLGQVDVLQAKIVQGKKTLGDVNLKEFVGTLSQFSDKAAVDNLEATTKNAELAKLLKDKQVANKVSEGYQVRGIFITNAKRDSNATAFLNTHQVGLVLYDHQELERAYVPIEKTKPIATKVSFDISSYQVLEYKVGSLKMVIAPIAADDLLKMDGIASGELFAWNVRQWLKKTKVNRDIQKSILTKEDHKYFPLFHNGLTVLCQSLKTSKDRVTISGYAVVNGCQSLSGLYENRKGITSDLRLLTKLIEISPETDLALRITDHTNNQNGTTYRDLQSNNPVQTRLQTEVHKKYKNTYFRIKRGEHPEWSQDHVIENELAARVLLAFDVKDPSSCHQTYKLFDELHADIFGRPEVNADRVVVLHDVYQSILDRLDGMSNSLFAKYSLTRYVILYLVREALETDKIGKKFCGDPASFLKQKNGRARLKTCIGNVASSITTILNNEEKRRSTNGFFDYKRDLKSPTFVRDLRGVVISQFEIIVANGFAKSFELDWEKSA